MTPKNTDSIKKVLIFNKVGGYGGFSQDITVYENKRMVVISENAPILIIELSNEDFTFLNSLMLTAKQQLQDTIYDSGIVDIAVETFVFDATKKIISRGGEEPILDEIKMKIFSILNHHNKTTHAASEKYILQLEDEQYFSEIADFFHSKNITFSKIKTPLPTLKVMLGSNDATIIEEIKKLKFVKYFYKSDELNPR